MSIYDEIKEERAAQDAKWGGPSHDDQHDAKDWVLFIVRHAMLAPDLKDTRPPTAAIDIFRRQMIRVAALAVAAAESADRWIAAHQGRK